MNTVWVSQSISQSVFYQVLMLSVMVCLKGNNLWKNNILFKIDTGKFVLLQIKRKAWHKLLSISWLKRIFCMFLSCTKILRCTKYFAQKRLWSFKNKRLFYIKYTVCFMISEKSITRCTFHCGGRMHQKYQQGIQKNCLLKSPILSVHSG